MFADPAANPFRRAGPKVSDPKPAPSAAAPAPDSPAAAALAATGATEAGTYPRVYPGYTVTGAVERIRWSKKKKDFAITMQQRGVPTIIENTIAKKWKARNWTLEYLKSRTPEMVTGIYFHSTEPRFGPLFRPKKPMGALDTVKWNNPHYFIDMKRDDFFDEVVNPKREANGSVHWLYYTGNLNSPDLLEDLRPYEELLFTPERAHIILWLGQAGVNAHLHLDSYENFFVQLIGRKRFLLFDPSQTPLFHPYPFLHPSHAQAQADIHNASDVARFPEMARLKCVEAVLGPGDMLYLPPLWWHFVEAIDVSVSVNLWSVSKQQDAFDNIINQAVKLVNHEWSQPEKRAASTYFIKQVLDGVGKTLASLDAVSAEGWERAESPSKAFAELLLRERYNPLFETGELPRESPDGLSAEELCGGKSFPDDAPERLAHLIEEAVDTFALRSPQPGNRLWWLGNFVETFAYWGTGNGGDAGPFIRHCLAMQQA